MESQNYLFNAPFQVVFAGPFEHHSNLLPWRELGAKVRNTKGHFNRLFVSSHDLQMVAIDEDIDGMVDLVQLEEKLKVHW